MRAHRHEVQRLLRRAVLAPRGALRARQRPRPRIPPGPPRRRCLARKRRPRWSLRMRAGRRLVKSTPRQAQMQGMAYIEHPGAVIALHPCQRLRGWFCACPTLLLLDAVTLHAPCNRANTARPVQLCSASHHCHGAAPTAVLFVQESNGSACTSSNIERAPAAAPLLQRPPLRCQGCLLSVGALGVR